MKITIKVASAFAAAAGNQKRFEMDCDGEMLLGSLLGRLAEKYPDLKRASGIGRDAIPDHVNVYHNGDNVRYLEGLNTLLNNGDIVQIIPAEAAG